MFGEAQKLTELSKGDANDQKAAATVELFGQATTMNWGSSLLLPQ